MGTHNGRSLEPGVSLSPGDRVLVIANPATRRNAQRLIETLRTAAPAGVQLDVHLTTRAGEAKDIAEARSAGAKLIVAIGGDGTVADCAHAVIASEIPIAVMPGGSTNITAREQGVPTDRHASSSLIFGPNAIRRIDAAMCDGRVFLHMAGAGFDAQFFASTNPALKRRFGWMAYVPAAAMALRHRPSRFILTIDGECLDVTSPSILVANGPSVIHPRLRIHPAIVDDDGMLDVLIVTATGPIEIARTLGRLGTMSFAKSPFLVHRRATEVRIEAQGDVPIEIDGDVFGTTPRTIAVLPKALRMVVPAG
jgi:YegS/Rv2252/BmrU family lipid kinase